MFAYHKEKHVAMVTKDQINALGFDVLIFDESNSAYQKQITHGGQLYVRDGILVHEPFDKKPIDVKQEIKEILSEAKDFDDFKKKLTDKLI